MEKQSKRGQVFESADIAQEPNIRLADQIPQSTENLDYASKASVELGLERFKHTKYVQLGYQSGYQGPTTVPGGAKPLYDEQFSKQFSKLAETRLQRRKRIQHELEEFTLVLEGAIAAAKEANKGIQEREAYDKAAGATSTARSKEIKRIENVLISGAESFDHLKAMYREAVSLLKIVKSFEDPIEKKAGEVDDQTSKSTMDSKIRDYMRSLSETAKTITTEQPSDNQITYEIYCNKGASRDAKRLKTMEEQVSALEACIFGPGGSTAVPSNEISLNHQLNVISRKLRNLDRGKLEAISESMKVLSQQADQVLLISNYSTADTENAKALDLKIHELYKLTHTYLSNRNIPQLIARIETLDTVSKQEGVVMKRLEEVEKCQLEMQRKLEVTRLCLDTLSESIESNVDIMAKNLQKLEGG